MRFMNFASRLPVHETGASFVRRIRGLPLLAVLAATCGVSGCARPPRAPEAGRPAPGLAGTARPRPEIPGAPAKSDVCMRSLFPRPMNERDPHDTLEAMRRFHVTRLEWTYGDNPEFIRKARDMGAVYGGALAAGSYVGEVPHEEWNVRDREGNPVYATWMRAWARPNPWGCANHPEFREGHVRAALRAVEAGADLLQRDEPRHQIAVHWGGCFCEFCMKGFNGWLARNIEPADLRAQGVEDLEDFDYRERLRGMEAPVGDEFFHWPGDPVIREWFHRFQAESAVAFNRWWREELNRRAGRGIPVSCNNGLRILGEVERVFDYCIGELSASDAQPEWLYSAMRTAHAAGLTQSATMPKHHHDQVTPDWIRLIRQTLATLYAVGGHMQMPWDTYLPTPDARRFFGDPADYADLSAFVRGMARFLDGYSDAFAAGGRIVDDRWPAGREPVLLPAGGDRVYAFVRAVPGDAGAPVVVHLLDWREEPEPFGLFLDPGAFFGNRPLRFRFFTPVRPYDPEAHDRAFETGDYSGLVRETEWPGGYRAHLEIPALTPWGVLVVEPMAGDPGGVWQPRVRLQEAPDGESVRLLIQASEPGAEILYTLDGSEPSEASILYRQPVEIREPAEVRVRAYFGGRPSAEFRGRLAREEASRIARSPDSPTLNPSLRLWLSALSLSGTVADGAPLPRWDALAGPAAETPDTALFDGSTARPPVFSKDALDGYPAVRFDGEATQLAIEGFANRALAGRAMTVFVLSRSDSPEFGLSGNERCGRGGAPRLYMTRQAFHYDVLSPYALVGAISGTASVLAYVHDGDETMRTYLDGVMKTELPGRPVLDEFGEGGHLAMPFWSGNRPHAGDLAEVIVYDRALSHGEIRDLSRYLARRYGLGWARSWALE